MPVIARIPTLLLSLTGSAEAIDLAKLASVGDAIVPALAGGR